MYKITDKVSVGLRKITPRLLKKAEELNLWAKEINIADVFQRLMDYVADENTCKEIIGLIFEIDDNQLKELDYSDIDLEEMLRGFWDFFYKLPSVLIKSEYYSKILNTSA